MILSAATCLALTVYFEARSESYDAQLAVAEVVINRRDSERWPDTICDVAFQRKQFSAFNHGIPTVRNQTAWAVAQSVADDALCGYTLGHGATHYHTVAVAPYWADDLELVGRYGAHVFYR